jgi:hypothetical protein
VQLRDQLAEVLAICANCPAAAPGGYLSRSLTVVEQLALTRCRPGWFEENREDREHEQNRRYCAVVSQLLRASTDAVQGPPLSLRTGGRSTIPGRGRGDGWRSCSTTSPSR